MSDAPYSYIDHARLVADLKAEDGRAVAWAYAQVFSSQVGRLVLTHQLAEAGVGSPRPPEMTALERASYDGEARHALRLLNLAGFGAMSVAHAVAADTLEGQDHDRHDDRHDDHGSDDRDDAGSGRFGGPDQHPEILPG